MSLLIGISMLLGYSVAEFFHKKMKRKMKREQLIAEYFDNQYWQFISIDEWLSGNLKKKG